MLFLVYLRPSDFEGFSSTFCIQSKIIKMPNFLSFLTFAHVSKKKGILEF